MKESVEEKDEPKKEEKLYELTNRQIEKIDKIIKENQNCNWMELNIYKKEDLDGFLEACKKYIFQKDEYKNEIMKGNLSFIMKISEGIRKFRPEAEPETFFILFKEVCNLFQSGLEQEYIIAYTEKIRKFILGLNNKDKIVLSNFNILFEVLVYLKVNQINQKKMEEPCKNLDKLLKNSLQSEEMEKNNKYLDTFFEIINLKLTSQQYVILNLLVDYLKTISSIKTNDNLIIFHGILKPIFQLQMDKNPDIVKSAKSCFKKAQKIEENFYLYYDINKNLMDDIFLIAIEESYQKNNKINYSAWNLLELFFKKWTNPIPKSPQTGALNFQIKTLIQFPEAKSTSKKRSSQHRLIKENSDNLHNLNLNIISHKSTESIYIPFKLFPKVISLILKSFEFSNDIIEKFDLTQHLINVIRSRGKSDIFGKDVVQEILKGMKNKKIKKKENLEPLLDYTFDIYSNNKYEEFIEFCNNYIEFIPTDDINDFTRFQELLLNKGFMNDNKNSNEFILEKLLNKIINSQEIINKELIYKSIGNSIDNYLKTKEQIKEQLREQEKEQEKEKLKEKGKEKELIKEKTKEEKEEKGKIKEMNKGYKDNMLYFFEIFAKVLDKISNENIQKNKIEKEQKNDNKSKININNNIINFEEKIVSVLSELLLNNSILNFRNSFLAKEEKEGEELFSKLYSIWAISPISLLLLCIATEKFELAYNIILNLKNVKFNDDFFKKLGKLVESFDKENYEYFWQKLLAPYENIFFIKTLFGILMILPQGVAFDYLSDKLSNVQTLLKVEDVFDEEKMIKKINLNKNEIQNKIDIFLKKQENIKLQKL